MSLLIPLTDEQREVQTLARDFAATEIAPHAARWDREACFPVAVARRMGELGFLGMLIPERYDGLGLDTTSYLLALEEIAARTRRPEQVVGMHFMNPVPVMQLVEIIRGLATSGAVTARTVAWSRAVGKTPVEVNDYPGFVANRILMPMINEAVYCVMEGVGTPEAIDTVMKLGMNHPMGPLTLADFIGLDTCLAILEVLHAGLGDPKYRPCPLLRKYVAAGWLGRKSGRGFYTY